MLFRRQCFDSVNYLLFVAVWILVVLKPWSNIWLLPQFTVYSISHYFFGKKQCCVKRNVSLSRFSQKQNSNITLSLWNCTPVRKWYAWTVCSFTKFNHQNFLNTPNVQVASWSHWLNRIQSGSLLQKDDTQICLNNPIKIWV